MTGLDGQEEEEEDGCFGFVCKRTEKGGCLRLGDQLQRKGLLFITGKNNQKYEKGHMILLEIFKDPGIIPTSRLYMCNS